MIKPIILSILLSQLSYAVLAQTATLPVYEIQSDTATEVSIPKSYWQIQEDKNNDETIQSITSESNAINFHIDSTDTQGIDYSIHTFWTRYALKNSMPKDLNILILNVNSAAVHDVYVVRTGSEPQRFITGELYPYDKRDGIKGMNAIPVSLQPGELATIYCRINFNYFVSKPRAITMAIGLTEKLVLQSYNDYEADQRVKFFEYFASGIYFFGLVLNLLFFLITREKIYVFLTIFLGYLLIESQLWSDYFLANNLPFYYYLASLISVAGIISYIQYLRHFFSIHIKTPGWDKCLTGICVLLAIFNIVTFFINPFVSYHVYDVIDHLYTVMARLGLLAILITLIAYRNSKKKSTALLLLSGLPVVIFETVFWIPKDIWLWLQEHKGVQPPDFIQWLNYYDNAINDVLMSWLAIVFSWILFQRFLDLQKKTVQQEFEKEKLEKEKELELRALAETQKKELEIQVQDRTSDLKRTLDNLKTTQSQLIQSEKMASLGQLTAGIAHEIQNPLNFVNNFSDINSELLIEMKDEMAKGSFDNARTIVNDVLSNEQKINHHGKRADEIIKGMLEHSRQGTGQKELTDINALADEYVKLAYHGMRVKDKTFNSSIKSAFDESLGKINIVPQDIGKVLLNLYNNAFYFTNEKRKKMGEKYEPRVTVTTSRSNSGLQIKVTDNGVGITPNIVEKIFQPFFTTKPTGQGTGLGLSLAYDIIKSHGGVIHVNTKENEGSEFIISIPG